MIKKQCLSIYCINKEGNYAKNTIYSVIAYISTKGEKIKLDKEKKAMLWEKISEKLSEKNWTVYKLCLKAGIGPAEINRLRDGEVKDLYFYGKNYIYFITYKCLFDKLFYLLLPIYNM